MNKNKISLDSAIEIAKSEYPDEEKNHWERMGFVGALIGVDSSAHFREEHGTAYKEGHKRGEEYLTVKRSESESTPA